MKRSEIRKAEGGKLLKVATHSEKGLIKEVKITGDFFVHPEGAIETIEEKLKGLPKAAVRGEIMRQEKEIGIRAIGFNLEDLISMIERCMR